MDPTTRTVVLVEGLSDKAAVETLALRLGLSFQAEGVTAVAMGGATNVRRFIDLYTRGRRLRVAGLYDEAEEDHVRSGLEQVGRGTGLTRDDLEQLGFYVCVTDLEDEMIRVLGVERVLEVVESEGEIIGFRRMQAQPQWREADLADQLHRFVGVKSGRKIRYGSLLTDALDLSHIPRPLDLLMRHLGWDG